MKKSVIWCAGLCLLAGAIGVLAQDRIDLSGTWKLDRSKSDAPGAMGRGGGRGRGGMRGNLPPGGVFPGARRGLPGGMGPGPNGDVILTIQQSANDLSVAPQVGASQDERTIQQHFALDGSQSTNPGPMGGPQIVSTAVFKDNALVIANTQKMSGPNGEVDRSFTEEYSLADNGQTLIIKTTRSTPRGDMSFKEVFNRQQQESR